MTVRFDFESDGLQAWRIVEGKFDYFRSDRATFHNARRICMPITEERCDRLNLHSQSMDNTARLGTAFTVTIDAREGITTGISAADRAHTIRVAVHPESKSADLARPGHIFPLRARKGGVLVRVGQTEGAVDLMQAAGLQPAGVICEIMNEDGTMARVPELHEYCKKHHLKMTSIAKLVEYRLQRETHIQRIQQIKLPTDYGEFKLIGYQSPGSTEPHLAICNRNPRNTNAAPPLTEESSPPVRNSCWKHPAVGSTSAPMWIFAQRCAEAGPGLPRCAASPEWNPGVAQSSFGRA